MSQLTGILAKRVKKLEERIEQLEQDMTKMKENHKKSLEKVYADHADARFAHTMFGPIR